MPAGLILLTYIVIGLVFGVVVVSISEKKGYKDSQLGFYVLGFLFNILALIIVLFIDKKEVTIATTTTNTENILTPNDEIFRKSFLNSIPKVWIAIYSLWVLLNLMFLLLFENTFQYKAGFWPFEFETHLYNYITISSYDYTEFIIYVLGPVFIAFAIYFINNGLKETTPKVVPAVQPKTESKDSVNFCKKCGAKVTEDSMFCSKCGAQLMV